MRTVNPTPNSPKFVFGSSDQPFPAMCQPLCLRGRLETLLRPSVPKFSPAPGICGLEVAAAATVGLFSSSQCGSLVLLQAGQTSQGLCQQLHVAQATGLAGASSKPAEEFSICSLLFPLPAVLPRLFRFLCPIHFLLALPLQPQGTLSFLQQVFSICHQEPRSKDSGKNESNFRIHSKG